MTRKRKVRKRDARRYESEERGSENVRLESARARLGNVKARLGAMRLKGAKLGNVKFGTVRIENMRLENMRLKNVRPQRSFSETDKARHLQLHLPGLDGNTAEHQQLRRLWLEDNRFGKCIERKRGPLTRPGRAREYSGKIRLEGYNSVENSKSDVNHRKR